MHQFMYDNFFEILLFGITCIQQQYRFSVITVYFEISGFSPFRIINKFQLYIPCRNNSQLLTLFFEQFI